MNNGRHQHDAGHLVASDFSLDVYRCASLRDRWPARRFIDQLRCTKEVSTFRGVVISQPPKNDWGVSRAVSIPSILREESLLRQAIGAGCRIAGPASDQPDPAGELLGRVRLSAALQIGAVEGWTGPTWIR